MCPALACHKFSYLCSVENVSHCVWLAFSPHLVLWFCNYVVAILWICWQKTKLQLKKCELELLYDINFLSAYNITELIFSHKTLHISNILDNVCCKKSFRNIWFFHSFIFAIRIHVRHGIFVLSPLYKLGLQCLTRDN